jgi:8-oxo-dGTP diphosphatase
MQGKEQVHEDKACNVQKRCKTVKTIHVTAGVIIHEDKVLITRRAPNENFAGSWEFPGGKIEPNETPEDCLVREIKEELNIDVSIEKFCTEVTHDYGHMIVHLMTYYCTIIKGDIQISVHDQYKWVKINDLVKYDLLPADIPIVKKIMEEYLDKKQ